MPVGAAAPDLAGLDQAGETHRLSDERGHHVVVYFYPKDGTPGCTKQACAFRDAWDRYKAADVRIYGVSADARESHIAFAREHDIPFPLIADPDFMWATAFGVGSKFGMTDRVSFLIDAQGKVAKVYPDVDPGVNATEMLAAAAALSTPAGAAPAVTAAPAAPPAETAMPAAPAAPSVTAAASPAAPSVSAAAAAPAAIPPK